MLSGLATYHLLKTDPLAIRGLPETPGRPISDHRRSDRTARNQQA